MCAARQVGLVQQVRDLVIRKALTAERNSRAES